MGTQDIIFEKIRSDFQLLSMVVLKQLHLCHELLEGKTERDILSEVVANEGIIDSLEVKLRSEVISTIVLHSPRAIDLRKIIAYYDITAYMERIGDLLLNVSEHLNKTEKKGVIFVGSKSIIEKLFSAVELMTQNAIFAFACEDNVLAHKTISDDDNADDLNEELMAYLAQPFDRVLSSGELSDLLQLGALAYNLERIGDNATNIAESAIYIIEGKDIKHNK